MNQPEPPATTITLAKVCSKCQAMKPLTDFYMNAIKKDGYENMCKECRRIQCNHYYRTKGISKRYSNLTFESFNQMMKDQQSACAICYCTNAKLCIDHNHATGKVRGLLCSACNRGLGQFKDNPTNLAQAISYLMKNGE